MVKPVMAERVAAEMAALSELPQETLAELWEQRFGCTPPRGCGRQLLELAASYAIQEKAFGGLKATARRALGKEPGKGETAKANFAGGRTRITSVAISSARSMKPGTRLVREWNGRTHHVEVAADGFVWNGKTHRSLSGIARKITGAQWSGPRFFGL